MGDDGLPGRHIQFTGFMLNPQRSPQDYGVLVKFRSLARFLPAFRTAHVGNADAGGRGVDMPDIFFDDLGLASRGFDARRMRNQSWHGGEGSYAHRNPRKQTQRRPQQHTSDLPSPTHTS